MGPKWQAIGRELGLALEHLAQGVLALDRANYQRPAEYHRAFFSLSLGFERLAKLAIVLDHVIDHGGTYPNEGVVRAYNHDIEKLLDAVAEIAERRGFAVERPGSRVQYGIVRALTQFAMNITRYYNLDLLTGTARADDPITIWWKEVRETVLAEHLTERDRSRIESQAVALGLAIEDFVLIRGHLETGVAFDAVDTGTAAVELSRRAIPWERMYVLQIVRWFAEVLLALREEAVAASIHLPDLLEFLGIYLNHDRYFRRRKTWSYMSP
jgi:hypothetical protein